MASSYHSVQKANALANRAGATWSDVTSVGSYHVVDRAVLEAHNRVMVKQLRERMGGRAPSRGHQDENGTLPW